MCSKENHTERCKQREHKCDKFKVDEDVESCIKALKKLATNETGDEASDQKVESGSEAKEDMFDKRAAIVNGAYKPSNDETDHALRQGCEDYCTYLYYRQKFGIKKSGIPCFWLCIFRNTGILCDLVQNHDELILKHLTDVKVVTKENPKCFVLEYHFDDNDFFSNKVLTKTYFYKTPENPDDTTKPLELYKSEGCIIDWFPTKALTIKYIKKREKVGNTTKFVTVTVKQASFFHFFTPPQLPEDSDAKHIKLAMKNDFALGLYFKDSIIPKAVLFFTGEMTDEVMFYDFGDDTDEEDASADDAKPVA
ncbi:nucleosome assembly protein 1-like 1 isoform X2 [Aethina tumida]|nr:nucleosome assembly protein 1-like 1 isoform X2 [Aethina tumida]XP_049817260.1 nucleosome assembly protein 1-like 1 isoform X2 [Aethina tumida]XP_049817261.1 nucleosome assembly protein 1-like 1 isoform X2 [Aethina tumida]